MPVSLHLQVRFYCLHQLRQLRNVPFQYLAPLIVQNERNIRREPRDEKGVNRTAE